MAADSSKSSGSADCYIGSFISLISKAEIRYEGFLFHINPQESTMGLRNVKSFGTEGRRKDGPQVLPSDKVYEYIFFQGRDIKDLQVISSPPVQSTPDVPNDPAIIQSHYPRSTSASSNFPSASAVSATNISSDAQLGLSNSIFPGNLPLSQPTGSLGSWGSLPPPPTGNGNGIVLPTYWPGHSGSSEGVSHLQQQSLLRPSQEFSDPMLPAVGSGSPSLTSSMRPPSALPSSVLIRQSAILPSKLSPNLMPNNVSNGLPTITWGSNSPLASPLMASSLDVNPLVPPVMDKPKSVFDPALPYQAISQSMPSIIGLSSPVHSETSIPSLLTLGQILQPGPTGRPSRHLQTAHKDIEVVQTSTSELLLLDSKSAKGPAHPLPSPTAEKLNGAALHSPHGKRCHVHGRENTLNKTALHTHHSERDHARGKGNWLNGTALRSHHSYRGHARGGANGLNGAALHHHQSNMGHARGRANGLNGAALHLHQSNRDHYRGRKNGPNTVDIHTHCSDRVRGRGKGAQVSPTMNKFTEDFDFEAMNEKFNKEEIWGHLGKSKQTRLEVNEGEENHKDANDTEGEDEDGLPKFDVKPVYVKDDFFDSLSCNALNRESGRGRTKFSEQRKIDIETFGEIPRHRHGPSSWGPGWGGRSRGSHGGRGYGYVGRGRGRGVWGSHVT